MENKEIVKQFIDNIFDDNDKAYAVLSDDVKFYWPGFGMEPIVGKKAIQDFFAKGGPEKVLSQKTIDIFSHGDKVVGHGTTVVQHNGKEQTSHFADFYTLRNGKIADVYSYMVMDRQKQADSEE